MHAEWIGNVFVQFDELNPHRKLPFWGAGNGHFLIYSIPSTYERWPFVLLNMCIVKGAIDRVWFRVRVRV
jgi:hypothetical protein